MSRERFGALWVLGVIAGLSGCGEVSDAPIGTDRGWQEPQDSDSAAANPDAESPVAESPVAESPVAESPVAAAAIVATTGSLATDDALARLRGAYPGVQVDLDGTRIRRIYGTTATGDTPRAAAESFRLVGARALGIAPNDLVLRQQDTSSNTDGLGLMYDPLTGSPKFRVFSYEQQRDGVPVFGSELRVLVRQGEHNPVVWANLDVRPLGSFRADASAIAPKIDLRLALQALGNGALAPTLVPTPQALEQLGVPRLTVFAGFGKRPSAPRMALQFNAKDVAGPGKWTFIADLQSGEILHLQSDVHFDVTGNVQAQVVLGSESMECGALGLRALPHAQVSSATNQAFTNAAGAFNLSHTGSAAVTLTSVIAGEFFDVFNDAGSPASLSLQVTPPGPAHFLHEDTATPPELLLAQLNAYRHASEVRDLLLYHVPDYPVIAGQTNFPIHVNRTDFTCDLTGGAWYDDDSAVRSINFCQRTAERANTAFGSIVHHEYGHHIVESGGSAQNEYGEGMADVVAMLLSKDPRMGLGFHVGQCNQPLRSADNECQYSATDCSSCGPGIYECGAVLTGTVWDIWQGLQSADPSGADELMRSLVLSSIPLHTGDSIDPSLAVDLLTLDDDDVLIENGTPHRTAICAGFEAHGMSCPPIVNGLVVKGSDLDAEGPSNGPYEPASASYTLHNLGPQQNLAYAVVLPPNTAWLSVSSNSGTIPLGGQVTLTVSVDSAQAQLLDDGDYTAVIQLQNGSSGVGNTSRVAKLRVGAPEPVFTATFDTGLQGFTADTELGNLWHRTTSCVDSLPGHSSPGSLFYGKDDVCNYATPVPNPHTITSQPIALANPAMAELGFNYILATENDPNYDNASVLVSVNGGPFTVVASNNDGGAKLQETNSWRPLRLELAPLLPPSGSSSIRIQVAFFAGDPRNNTNKGFALDDLIVYAKAATTPSNAFLEQAGQVVIEAEHFSANTPRSGHTWSLATNGGASGQAMMSALPNTGMYINDNYASTSPALGFPIRFVSTGTYYVWLRGSGATANDDSCHVGLDGVQLASADRISTFNAGLGWTRSTMDGPVATLQVTTAGIHTLDVWMREDGLSLDKLVLTKNANYVPSGAGPNESAREGGNLRPCSAHCQNPIAFNSSNYQSGNLGTAASCHETTAQLAGGVCGNLAAGRKLFVNGVQMTCNWSPWPSLPAKVNGGYCVHTTAGDYAWAAFTTW